MSQVEWIKIKTDMFDHKKIKFIRNNIPEGNDICLIWVMLLCLSGKTNNHGQLLLTDNIPYNDETLSSEFNFPVNTIRLAIETFKKLDMVELIDTTISITGWYEHQSADKLDRIQQQNRERQRRFKNKQKLIGNVTDNVTYNVIEGNVKITSSCSYSNSYSNNNNNNNNKDNIYILKIKIKEKLESLNIRFNKAIFDFSKDCIYKEAIDNYGLELLEAALNWWNPAKQFHPRLVSGYNIDLDKLVSCYQSDQIKKVNSAGNAQKILNQMREELSQAYVTCDPDIINALKAKIEKFKQENEEVM